MLSIGYDEPSRTLEIEFESGAVYVYSGVSVFTYRQLLNAESKGRYFNAHIKDVFPFERL